MALPSPTTVFLHHIFDGVGYENVNIHPTLAMLFGEEEDVFASAFKEANSFSGPDVKPDALRLQPMLFTNQAAETPLDDASAHANYHISGPQSPSWQLMEEWQLSSPVTETCQSKAAVIRQPSVQLDSPSYTKSLSSPSEFNTSPNQRTKAPQRQCRKKPLLSTAERKAIRAKFMQRNRIVAGTCRKKRKDWITSLEEELKRESTIATLLETEHEDLMKEVKMFREEASLHTECVLSDISTNDRPHSPHSYTGA